MESDEITEEASVSLRESNIDADDLDEETVQKLRGDTIGDTLFSQSFVLKTLLQFSDLKWDEQVEEELCFLWDMTVEKDVCKFLLELSYPSLACNAILSYRENNRFVEIVIGILGNLFCSGCENNMTASELATILNTLDTDDHLILIQLMRFINASLETTKPLVTLVDSDFMDKINFIFKNSVNCELLLKTLECIGRLTSDFRISENLIVFGLYESVIAAYQTLTRSEGECFEPDTKEKLLSVKYLLEIITNICSYIEKFEKTSFLLQIQNHSNVFTCEIIKILKFFSLEENLLPVSDEVIFFVSAITYTYTNLKLNYIPDIFLSVTKILVISVDIKDEVDELFETALELECYLVSCTRYETVQKDLKSLSRQKAKRVINLVNENSKKYGFSINFSDFE